MGYDLGGSFALGPWRVRRAGYGAMQLAGDGVFGPPRDRDEALRVLRAAVEAGVDHVDTAQYYGAGTVNVSPNRWLKRWARFRDSSRCCRWSSPTGTSSAW